MKNLFIVASVLSFVMGCSSNKTLSEPEAPKQETLVLKQPAKTIVEDDPEVLVSHFPEVNACYLNFRKTYEVSPTFVLKNCSKPQPKYMAFAANFIGATLAAKDKATSAEVFGIYDAVKLSKNVKELEHFKDFLQLVAEQRNEERQNVVRVVRSELTKDNCYNEEEGMQIVRDAYSCVADLKTDSYDDLYREAFLNVCEKAKLKNCKISLDKLFETFPEKLQDSAQASKMIRK